MCTWLQDSLTPSHHSSRRTYHSASADHRRDPSRQSKLLLYQVKFSSIKAVTWSSMSSPWASSGSGLKPAQTTGTKRCLRPHRGLLVQIVMRGKYEARATLPAHDHKTGSHKCPFMSSVLLTMVPLGWNQSIAQQMPAELMSQRSLHCGAPGMGPGICNLLKYALLLLLAILFLTTIMLRPTNNPTASSVT